MVREHSDTGKCGLQPDGNRGGRWRLPLLTFLAVAGLLLVYEHRAHVFSGEGVLLGLLVLCVAMHLFMHGGHGNGR